MTENIPRTIVGLGEILWDILPSGKQLGGAPANFAYISRLLGDHSVIASRVGEDAQGREALERLNGLTIETAYIQRDPANPTGTASVSLSKDRNAEFVPKENVAWDHLEWTIDWKHLAARADAVCYGTLAQRSLQSRQTIQRFLEHTRPEAVRIFDINLRGSAFTRELLAESIRGARILKLNSEESSTISDILALDKRTGGESIARHLIQIYGLEMVAITRGAHGSLIVTRDDMIEHPGFDVGKAADTIGAGDAFAATLVHYHLRQAPVAEISEAANRAGAWIATQDGATPIVDPRELQDIVSSRNTK
jgi:fructokinase